MNIKRIFTILAIIIIPASGLYAQLIQNLSVGPTLGFKFGTNYNIQMEGRTDEMKIAKMPELGVSVYSDLTEDGNLGVGIDLLYNSYSNRIVINETKENFDFNYSYLTISPKVIFHNFTLGFTFGYPLSANFGNDISTDNIRFLTEFNLGYSYPVLVDDFSRFNIYIKTGLMLSSVFYDFPNNDPLLNISPAQAPEIHTEKYNPRLFSISIGLNYQFNIYSPSIEESNPISQ